MESGRIVDGCGQVSNRTQVHKLSFKGLVSAVFLVLVADTSSRVKRVSSIAADVVLFDRPVT